MADKENKQIEDSKKILDNLLKDNKISNEKKEKIKMMYIFGKESSEFLRNNKGGTVTINDYINEFKKKYNKTDDEINEYFNALNMHKI